MGDKGHGAKNETWDMVWSLKPEETARLTQEKMVQGEILSK